MFRRNERAMTFDEEGHVLDMALDELAGGAGPAEAANHVAACPYCRIRYRRLLASAEAQVDVDEIARALPPPPRVPAGVIDVLGAGSHVIPAPEQVWLTVGPQVSMVWIRRVIERSALVQPVVFDVEMADEHTLVLPAKGSPFGVPLAVICSFDAQVDLDKLDRQLFTLSIGASVETLRAARKSGTTTPPDVTVGPPVEEVSDERHEFRQIVADRIASLAAQEDDPNLGSDLADFEGKIEHLRTRRPHCRALPCGEVVTDKAETAGWRALATIREIGSAVVVLLGSLDSTSVSAAREILDLASATAVAFTEDLEDYETRVYEPGDLAELRYTVPSGDRLDSGTPVLTLDLVDALFKYFDATAIFADEVDLIPEGDGSSEDIAEIVSSEAKAAVDTARSRRYQRLKGDAFKALSGKDATFIATIVMAGASGEPVVDALRAYARDQ